ncbi:hypothetical protein LSH36_75g05032 [Paralvinella palmiformis]|uniref:ATP synthase F(0) complex subunit e, mitochondrial n=1 Tax=Paralvinella palmiformis TaxID=53620 RepID=A0AAD9K411_9ANNE|nr:hypothetical protein LSH36_75g05032 [Paralvinella palmiformis]
MMTPPNDFLIVILTFKFSHKRRGLHTSKMSTLPAPKNVSALIRFSRWAALGTGLMYGLVRFSYLKRKEARLQEADTKIREAREAKLKAEKDAKAKAELDDLAKEAGIAK